MKPSHLRSLVRLYLLKEIHTITEQFGTTEAIAREQAILQNEGLTEKFLEELLEEAFKVSSKKRSIGSDR
jgi:hypothetical protein